MSSGDGRQAERLRESLLRVLDRKHHWYWDHLHGPAATRDQLLVHFQQEWEVHVRDHPAFLRRVHDRCPYPDVRSDLIKSLEEKERGTKSGGTSDRELYLLMMEGLGFSRKDFTGVSLLPAAAAYRRWIDEATQAWWLVGGAVARVFVEGSVKDRSHLMNGHPSPSCGDEDSPQHPLVVHHGLDPRALELWRAQRQAVARGRHGAYRMTVGRALTASARRVILAAVEQSLELWEAYREELALRCAATHRPARRAGSTHRRPRLRFAP
jgi:pyrroloquinoline-quinone synthase